MKEQIYTLNTITFKTIKLKYKNSVLGFFWSLLTPIVYLSIFTFIFSNAFPNIDNYPLFAISAKIFWTYFANSSIQIVNSVISSAGILKSVNINSLIFPLSALFAETFNLLLSFIPFGILMFLFGFEPSWELLLLIPAIILFMFFTLGFSLILCALNVFYRDVGILWGTLMPALFYFTPIAYSYEVIPKSYQWVVKFNPLFHYIDLFRQILYYNEFPSLELLVTTTLLSIVFFGTGWFTYKKLERGFISNF